MAIELTDRSEPPSDRPIAVLVDRDGLGDAVLKLPFLRAVSRAYPGRPIWWIANHQTAMAQQMAPLVGGMLTKVIENAGTNRPMGAVIKRLRQFPPFELVFDTRSRVLTVVLAKMFLNYRRFFCCLPGYVLSDRRPPGRWTRPNGIGARMLSVAEAAIDGPPDWQGSFDIGPQARAAAEQRLPAGPRYVGLATGSRDARKNWPLDRFIALAHGLAADGAVPVFFTGPEERELVDQLRAAVPGALFPQAEPVDATVAPIEFAIAIGDRLQAAVANDSGIGHLLGALQIPLVSLFGWTDPDRWAPFNSRGVAIRAQEHGGTSMDAIPVEAVLSAVRRLLAKD